MVVKDKSFHEIAEYVRNITEPIEVNHILSQMVQGIYFEDYDKIDAAKARKKVSRYRSNLVKVDEFFLSAHA